MIKRERRVTNKHRYNKFKKRKNSKQLKNSKKSKKRGKKENTIDSFERIRYKGGGYHINFSKIIYEFIDANVELFDINNITEDHSMDMDCLKKYIEYQKENKKTSKLFWNFYEYLYKNIIYITNDYIKEQYEKNAHEIHKLSKNVDDNGMNYHVIFILIEDATKSNYYFTLYFLYLYKNLYPDDYENIDVIMESEIVKGIANNQLEHTIYVVTDDFSYSGDQMLGAIQHKYNKQFRQYTNGKSRNYSIYINVFGITYTALKRIESILTWVKLRIPNDCKIFDNITYNAIFNKYCKENNYDIEIESVDMFYFTKDDIKLKSFRESLELEIDIDLELPLIYLSYKYPDFMSFPTQLCYFMDMPKTYFIAHDDYIGENIVTFNNNIHENFTDDGMFHETCSRLGFVFQFNSMELFAEKYPKLVYTITKELGTKLGF